MADSDATQLNPADDESMLFAMLALRMEFINHEQFQNAIQTWMQDRSSGLDQVLLSQSSITQEQHEIVSRLWLRNLELNRNHVEDCLATIQVDTTEPKAGDSATERGLDQTMPIEAHDSAQSSDNVSHSSPGSGAASNSPRFQPVRPHARGGLGEVFVALDKELNRFVALKEIQLQHASHLDSRSRFQQEAEITGGLEHPGIVPVYGKGIYPDGRPYYAMRFIDGESMREAIQSYHGNNKDKEVNETSREEEPATKVDPVLALHKLLGRFVDVCNAMHYAHSRGIIHRDIKPANIMLGRFGETLVVDWGLAKTIGASDSPLGERMEPKLRPSSGSGTAPTQLGEAIGTPGYMSPEQAAGLHDQLTATCDIYGLGATLYSILTGKPPFSGKDITRLLESVKQGDFLPPRKVSPAISKPLEAICLKAMANKPSERYQSAQDLADDIQRWMVDEPVSCFRPGILKQLQRAAKRHAAAVAGSVAAIAVTACALIGFSVALSFKNQELLDKNYLIARSQAQLQIRNEELAELVSSEKSLNRELADSVLEQQRLNDELTQSNTDLGKATLEANEKRAQAEAAEELANIRQGEAEAARNEYEYLGDFMVGLFSGSDPIGISELNRLIPSKPPQDLTARDLLQEGETRLSKLDATPLTKARIMNSIGSSYRTLGDLESAERMLSQALEIRRTELPADDLAIAESLYLMGWLKHDAGEYFEAEQLYRESLRIREAKLEAPHLLVASTRFQLGWLLSDMYQFEESKEQFRQCLKIRQKLLPSDDRRIAIAWAGVAANKLHAGEEDIQLFNAIIQAIRIFEKAGVSELAGETVMNYQSAVLASRLNQTTKAKQLYQKTIEQSSTLLHPEHPWVALARFDLAVLLEKEDRLAEAHEELKQVMVICNKGLPRYHPKRAIAANEHAYVAERLGHYEIAAEGYAIVAEITEHRLLFQPDSEDAINDYSVALKNWGDALQSLESYSKAEEVKLKRLQFAESKNTPSLRIVYAQQSLANLYIASERYSEAVTLLDAAREQVALLRKADQNDRDLLREDSYTHYRLGLAQSQQQNWNAAIDAMEYSLEGYLELSQDSPQNRIIKRNATKLEQGLISHYLKVKRNDAAEAMSKQHWNRISDLVAPEIAKLLKKTEPDDAERQALASLYRQLGIASSYRANVLEQATEFESAIEWRQKSLDNLTSAQGHYETEQTQTDIEVTQQKIAELEAELNSPSEEEDK